MQNKQKMQTSNFKLISDGKPKAVCKFVSYALSQLHEPSPSYLVHMTDQAGTRRCECHPGTEFWHQPVEETQFWRPFPFSKDHKNKNRLINMKQNCFTVLQVTVV